MQSVIDELGRAYPVAEPKTVFTVDARLAGHLVTSAQALASAYAGQPLDRDDLMIATEVEMRRSSPELVAELIRFRNHSSAEGIMVIRGLRLDEPLPPTPDGAFDGPWQRLGIATISQLMIMSVLGNLISYADEKEGRLIQDVCPVRGAEERQENTGSCLLELHTEDGFHPNKPHFVSLLGLRGDHDHQAVTVAAGIRSVLGSLPAEQLRRLRQPLFRIRLSSSFVGPDRAHYTGPLPVLAGPHDDPELCVDFHGTEPTTEEARDAMRALRDLLLDNLVGAVIEPGDMFIIDNHKAVHGRTGFSPRYDGRDRWLRRCFGIRDLRVARPHLHHNSRVHRPLVESVH